MKEKIKKILGIIKGLPRLGKIGFVLWIIGFPIGAAGIILLAGGHYALGTFLLVLPIFEGNFGIILMGKEIFPAIKKEFSRKNPQNSSGFQGAKKNSGSFERKVKKKR